MGVPVRAAASAFSASSKGVAESAFLFPLTRRGCWALADFFGDIVGGFEVYPPFLKHQ